QLGALAQYRAQALLHRAVRIFRGLALGVVLAMDRGPFPGIHAGGQPQPETEEVLQDRMQLERAGGRISVQINGYADDGDMGQNQDDGSQLPGGRINKTVVPHASEPLMELCRADRPVVVEYGPALQKLTSAGDEWKVWRDGQLLPGVAGRWRHRGLRVLRWVQGLRSTRCRNEGAAWLNAASSVGISGRWVCSKASARRSTGQQWRGSRGGCSRVLS